MYFVEGSIHAHCGAEPGQLLILSEACQDGSQSSSTEVGRAERDDGAHLLDGNAVRLRGVQAQIHQDLSRIGQAFFIPSQGTGREARTSPCCGHPPGMCALGDVCAIS